MTKLMDIKIDSLCFPDAKDSVLKDIDLQVSAGEFIVVTGPSDVGKSVLLSCLAGVIPLHKVARLSGEIKFQGQPISRLPEAAGKMPWTSSAFPDMLDESQKLYPEEKCSGWFWPPY